jgi:hypothetical protein
MSSPPVATATSAGPLSISVPEFTSIRECITWLVDWAQARGSDVGYRKMSRLYHQAKMREADRIDIAEGVQDGRRGQDLTMSIDPTGETAVRNVMREVILHG